jgi:cytochrome oxidase Cu insertion factor (SCO1/SenC/PrrC family)
VRKLLGPSRGKIPDYGFPFLQSVYWLLLSSLCLLITSYFSQLTASAQIGVPKGGSPLYNSRPYSPSTPSGLPKALSDVGIDQKLNEQLPLDLEFRNESGQVVRLRDYFGKKPVVLSLVYYQCPMLCNS